MRATEAVRLRILPSNSHSNKSTGLMPGAPRYALIQSAGFSGLPFVAVHLLKALHHLVKAALEVLQTAGSIRTGTGTCS